jgi:hypothetical protein
MSLVDHHLDLANFNRGKSPGSGGSSEVYLGVDKSNGREVVLKM